MRQRPAEAARRTLLLGLGTADAERLRDVVRRLLDEHRVPGIAVGMVVGDDLLFSEGFGFADVETQTPMTPQHSWT